METLHASAVAFGGKAVLLTGASGSGKSTLALELIALGGALVADDRVVVQRRPDGVWLDAPERLRGLIEARGVGLLKMRHAPARAVLVVDMERVETARLPGPRSIELAGVELPCLHKVESPVFAAMVRAYLDGEGVA
jgi:HPr kinase/phosphorylase